MYDKAGASTMSGRFPKRFGKYVLLKPLAKGGMGEIYIAAGGQVGGFEKLCVIKKVITEKADRSKANRFLDEAKVVLRLSHSCLVTTFDAGEVDGEFYIAMELVEGKDLREVWNRCVRTRQRIPLDVALHVVRELARALSYVHGYANLKLVHRDVAPPNILLAYVGDVKLTDFGLARSVLKQEHTAPGVVYGRAAYLAPEQARGEVADARTDVYTLGVVLWELLTGQQFLQISGLDPATALAVVRHPKINRPSVKAPWITPDLDNVVMKALAPDRADRFESADQMRKALGDVIATIAPRAGADRVSEFIESIYADSIAEETAERDRFLGETIPRFRGEPDAVSSTRTGVEDLRAGPPKSPPKSPTPPAQKPQVRVAKQPAPLPRRRPRSSEALSETGRSSEPRLPGLPPSPPPVFQGSGATPRPLEAVPRAVSNTPPPRPSVQAMRAAVPPSGRSPAPGTPFAAAPGPAARPFTPPAAPVSASPLPTSPFPASPFPASSLPMGRADGPGVGWGDDSAPDFSAIDDGSTEAGRAFARKFMGKVLGGRYRVLSAIGEGGMGQVFSAEHIEIGKKAAVKVLHPACSARPDLVERFRLEARAASKIGHPGIVDVTDFGTTEDGLVYYIMEQLQGVDLAEVLAQERRIDPDRAVQIAVQMCQALQAAHDAEIIHRDLKPENVFLQPRGAQGDLVKIIDFGLARSLEGTSQGRKGRRLTNPGTPIGTPEYMAPEQADGKPADARSDLYAVGAILYEMVTGYPAFGGQSYADVITRRKSDLPRPPVAVQRGVSKPLSDLIMRTLQRDPSKRPGSMAKLEYELTKISRGRGQAVADLLGIEPDQASVTTPTPVGLPVIQSIPGAAAAASTGGSVSHDDLTVPAATIFPENEASAQSSIPGGGLSNSAAAVAGPGHQGRVAPDASHSAPVAGQAFLQRNGPPSGRTRTWVFVVGAVVVIAGAVGLLML